MYFTRHLHIILQTEIYHRNILGRSPAAAVTEACLTMSCNIHMNELPLIDATYSVSGEGENSLELMSLL